jgi:hypothetical protein
MALLGNSEKEDFLAIVRAAGYLPADFELSETEERPTTTEIYAVRGTANVARKSTNVSRKYQAGHATSWLAEFEKDLQAGVYGKA